MLFVINNLDFVLDNNGLKQVYKDILDRIDGAQRVPQYSLGSELQKSQDQKFRFDIQC